MSKHHSKLWGIAAAAVLAMTFQGSAWAGDAGCKGECYEAVPPKPIHKKFKYRVMTKQGEYSIAREPALYGWAKRPYLEWHEAEYRTETVQVRLPARTTWEKRWVKGRYVMCKVRVPGEVVERERRVKVHPAGYVQTGEWGEKRILLKQYKNIAIYDRARHEYSTDRVVIQPEGHVWRRVRKSEFWD